MNWGLIAKYAARFVVGTSVNQVVSNVIKANTPQNLRTFEKVMSVVGEFVVSCLVGDVAADYVDKQIEELSKTKLEVKIIPDEETKEK